MTCDSMRINPNKCPSLLHVFYFFSLTEVNKVGIIRIRIVEKAKLWREGGREGAPSLVLFFFYHY